MRWARKLGFMLGILLLGAMLLSCGSDKDADKAKEDGQKSTQVEQTETGPASEQQARAESGQASAPTEKHTPKTASLPTPVGKLVLVRGKVIVKRNNGKQILSPSIGDQVYLNDRIITSKDGYARMHMRDDSILRIAPSSELAVTTQLLGPEHSNTTIDLLKGKLRAIVVHKLSAGDSFEVETDVAVAGVRGTDFEVIAGGGRETVVRCFKGVVAITNTDTKVTGGVLLTPRTYTKVVVETPPIKPQPLSPQVIPLEDPEPLSPQVVPMEAPEPMPSPPTETTGTAPAPKAAAAGPSPVPVPSRPPAVSTPVPAEAAIDTNEAETAVEPVPATVEEPAMTQEQADSLIEQSYQKSQKNLQQGDLQELWEQDSDQPLQQMLYGDGLDGWTMHPAK